MDLNRDSFISEEIINYLQSSYDDIYSDSNIITNYSKYKELLLKKETAKNNINTSEFSIIFRPEDEEELESLNRYFYGNSDGSSSGDGNNIAYTYLSTIQTIKNLIDKSDNNIKDVVFNLTSLLSKSSMSDEAYKRYLNELIIPGILGTSEISSDKSAILIEHNKKVINDLSQAEQDQYKQELFNKKKQSDARDNEIRLKKEQAETELVKEKQNKLNAETEIIKSKKITADRLKIENQQELNKDKRKILEQKKKDIMSDINLKKLSPSLFFR